MFPTERDEGPELTIESKTIKSCFEASSNKEQACEYIPLEDVSLCKTAAGGEGEDRRFRGEGVELGDVDPSLSTEQALRR